MVRRGNEAAMILGHELVVEALTAMRADAYLKLEQTGWNDKDAREALYHQLRAITNFEAQFAFHIENGRLAAGMLEKWQAERRAAKRRR